MKQVLVKGGAVLVQQVPSPRVGPRKILVRLSQSGMSVRTEMKRIEMSTLPLNRGALKRPSHVKRVLLVMRDQGFKRTCDVVTGQRAALPIPLQADSSHAHCVEIEHRIHGEAAMFGAG